MRIAVFILLSALICANFVFADESSERTETEEKDWTDKAKEVGSAVVDSTKSGLVKTKEYFGNNTVGDIAGDVADGAKSVGNSIADGAKKIWKGVGDLFS